jgi:hypothetical protein
MHYPVYAGLSAEEAEAVRTDKFPRARCCLPVPNSHRFDQSIASLADPLALDPQGLIGLRTRGESTPGHAVFLFEDAATEVVLPAYARRLLAVLPDDVVRTGRFTAIGHVHRPKKEGERRLYVGDYLPGYDHECLPEARPTKFIQYLNSPRTKDGDVRVIVERTAEALLHLVLIANPSARPPNRQRRHLVVLEALESHPDARRLYLSIAEYIARGRRPSHEDEWRTRWVPRLKELAASIADVEMGDVGGFLDWSDASPPASPGRPINAYQHPHALGTLTVEVGSIHGAKGETHTGTLVLETFFMKHHLARLMPWLLGERSGGKGTSDAVRESLKQHYVAMTRPTHLLCLAMRGADVSDTNALKLKERGWGVARISTAGESWL